MTTHTQEEKEKALVFYKTLPLKDLRRRQDICNAQTKEAYRRKHIDALTDLQDTSTLLAEAVDHVAFVKPTLRRKKK